jgi:hypothetical protein
MKDFALKKKKQLQEAKLCYPLQALIVANYIFCVGQ